MIILTIRTDKPEAEIGLFDGTKKLAYDAWPAHRQLAETLHRRIEQLLSSQGLTLKDKGLDGLVCYKGPGSFTGLRIGLTVANTIAYSLDLPMVGSAGSEWINDGIKRLQSNENEKIVLPEYGSEPHITKPKK